MCGIAGIYVRENYIGQLPIDSLATELLQGIEHRGKHATGYVAVDKFGRARLQKDDVTATEFNAGRERISGSTRMVLLHTRYATKGKPEEWFNNHPVMHKSCFVTHNGHVDNDTLLFNELGEQRGAEVDSVAIAAVLSSGGLDDNQAIVTALERIKGRMAIAAVDPSGAPGRLLLAKGSQSPLWVLNHKKCIIWASERKVIEDAWGTLMGTPTKKQARLYGKPEDRLDPTDPGKSGIFYEFGHGDIWLIEDDNISVAKFRPAFTSYQSGTTTGPCSTTRSTKRKLDDGKRNTTTIKTWLCTGEHPNDERLCSVAEDHKCWGCDSLSCKCYEQEFIYSDPAPWGKVDADGNHTEEHPDVTSEIRCDVCYDYFAPKELNDKHMGFYTLVVCEACELDEEWEDKIDEETYRNGGKGLMRVVGQQRHIEAVQEVAEAVDQARLEARRAVKARRAAAVEATTGKLTAADSRHIRVCTKVAEIHGCNPVYVNWLLFEAKEDDVAKDENVLRLRCLLDDEYRAVMIAEKL